MPFLPSSFFIPTIFSPETGGAAPPPGEPENFAVTERTAGDVTVEWDAVEGVSYRVQAQIFGEDWGAPSHEYAEAETPLTLSPMNGAGHYEIRIRAENGEEDVSEWVPLSVYLHPSVETSFAVESVAAESIQVTWTAIEGLTARVQAQESGGDWSELVVDDTVAPPATGFMVPGLDPDTHYGLRMRWESVETGAGEWYELDQYTRPEAPTGLAGGPGNWAEVNLTWDALDDDLYTLTIYSGNSVALATGVTGAGGTFNFGAADFGYSLSLTAVSLASGLESDFSASVDVASGAGAAPTNLTPPSQSGALTEGEGINLVATPGSWDGDPVPDVTYEWFQDGSVVSTSDNFTLGNSVGSVVFCRVTATNAVGSLSLDTNETTIISP